LYVIFGTYNKVKQPIYFTLEEHNAARLVDVLNSSSLIWEQIGYDDIISYRKATGWKDYPFTVQRVSAEGYVIKPNWIDFEDMQYRRQSNETSRTRESGILPDPTIDDRLDSESYQEAKERRINERIRSMLRGR
jgi:hypothetical protein